MARFEAIHPVLMSGHVVRSIEFFQRLGFALAFQDDPADPKYACVRRDGVELHLQWQDQSQWAYPSDRPTYRFFVDDVDTLHRELIDRGVIVSPFPDGGSPWQVPGDTPWGTREFHLRDPDGNGLQFYRPR